MSPSVNSQTATYSLPYRMSTLDYLAVSLDPVYVNQTTHYYSVLLPHYVNFVKSHISKCNILWMTNNINFNTFFHLDLVTWGFKVKY